MLTAKTVKEALIKAEAAERVANGEEVVIDLEEAGKGDGEKVEKESVRSATSTIITPNAPDDAHLGSLIRYGKLRDRVRMLRDLVPEEHVDKKYVRTLTFGYTPGLPAFVSEDGQKTNTSANDRLYTYSPNALSNIAQIVKVSEEMLSDYDALTDAIIRRMEYAHDRMVSNYVATRLHSAYSNSGDGSLRYLWENIQTLLIDGYMPDGIVLGQDWIKRLVESAFDWTTDENGVTTATYTAANKNHPVAADSPLLSFDESGMKLAGIPAVPNLGYNADLVIGDFATGSKLYTSGKHLSIGHDGSDFSNDRITLRMSEAVYFDASMDASGAFIRMT